MRVAGGSIFDPATGVDLKARTAETYADRISGGVTDVPRLVGQVVAGAAKGVMSDLTFGMWDNEPAFQPRTKLEAAGKKFGSFSASFVGAIRGGSGGAKLGTKGIAHSRGWTGSTRQFANKVPHRVTLNRTSGLSFEARVLQVFGLVKNSTMVAGMSKRGMRNVVPDVRTSNAIYEIKSGIYIWNSTQIEAMMDYAAKNNLVFNLVKRPGAKVAEDLRKRIIRRGGQVIDFP